VPLGEEILLKIGRQKDYALKVSSVRTVADKHKHADIYNYIPGVTSMTATTTSPQMTSITSSAMTIPRQFLLSDSPPTNSYTHGNDK